MVYHSHWFERLWMKWFTVHIGLSVVDDLAVLHVDPTNLHKVAVVRAITTVTTIKFYFYNIILNTTLLNKVENFDNNHFSNHFSLVSEQNTEFFNEKTTNDFFLGFVRLSL